MLETRREATCHPHHRSASSGNVEGDGEGLRRWLVCLEGTSVDQFNRVSAGLLGCDADVVLARGAHEASVRSFELDLARVLRAARRSLTPGVARGGVASKVNVDRRSHLGRHRAAVGGLREGSRHFRFGCRCYCLMR